MAAERWLRVATLFLAVSIFLQLVAFVTPGWFITSVSGLFTRQYQGLLYVIMCYSDTGCKTQTIVEWFQASGIPDAGYTYYIVTNIFRTVVPLILCTATCVLKVSAIRKSQWSDFYQTTSLLFLGISNTLQWLMVSDFANSSVRYPDDDYNAVYFPWSLFIFAQGSFLTFATMAADLVVFCRAHYQSGRHDGLLVGDN